MGYTTEFEGVLKFTSPLTAEQELFLKTIIPDDGCEDSENHPDWIKPKGYNGYVQLVVSQDGSGIVWDGNEKFYDAVDAVNTVIMTMQSKFPEFGLSGYLDAQGEEVGDVWMLMIVDGKAVRKDSPKSDDIVTCPHCDEQFKLADAK